MPTTATQLSDAQRQMFRKDGYLILRNTFSSDRVQSLVDAVDRWLNRALAGEFTKPTEWIDREHRIPRVVYNMLHPENMILHTEKLLLSPYCLSPVDTRFQHGLP